MIKTEFLIVGQGITGTFLSWYFNRSKRAFVVIDHYDSSSSSQVAAGIINPVTGRRIVKTWMIDELLPFALNAYEEIGQHLGINTISKKTMIDFFPSVQMMSSFTERAHQDDYLKLSTDFSAFKEQFNYDFGFGEIEPCYLVNLKELLLFWRIELKRNNLLIEDNFDEKQLKVNENHVVYKDVYADKIIFCNGIYSSTNKFFRNLPFALNKGEALIIYSDKISEKYIYKKGITLVPIGKNLFWTGSSHEWNFTDNLPSKSFLEKTTGILSNWLRHPFEVVNHLASIRPATVERRPFVGMHPYFPSVGILNGMGTKGCSLSSYFAQQLVSHLIKNTPILPEADIKRFSGILNTSN